MKRVDFESPPAVGSYATDRPGLGFVHRFRKVEQGAVLFRWAVMLCGVRLALGTRDWQVEAFDDDPAGPAPEYSSRQRYAVCRRCETIWTSMRRKAAVA